MESGQEDYCPPGRYAPQRDRFYRNRGGGKFVDATAEAGMARDFGPALGVSTADFNGDGWIDIFVANDQKENQLWINLGNGTFENRALTSGVALDGAGVAKANMGVDAGDFDNDGDEDLLTTVLTREKNPLFVNDGTGRFEDRSMPSGIGTASHPNTGWGVAWLDVDNDGWLDLLAVNGLVKQDLDALSAENPFPYQQRNQLLRNLTDGRFEDVTNRAGRGFALKEVGRGAAFGDVDNDGDVDVLVANSGGPARLLINGIGDRSHWLGLRLVGGDRGRDMVGARVAVIRADGRTVMAPGAGGRKLRLGERSTGAGRARGFGGCSARSRHLAERAHRGVDRRARRPLHDIGGRERPLMNARVMTLVGVLAWRAEQRSSVVAPAINWACAGARRRCGR